MKVYTKYDMITLVLNNITNGKSKFICPTFENILGVGAGKALRFIPELLEYKPKEVISPTSAWFLCNDEGRQKRIEILQALQERFKPDNTTAFIKYEIGDQCQFYLDNELIVGEIENIDQKTQLVTASTKTGIVRNIPLGEIFVRML